MGFGHFVFFSVLYLYAQTNGLDNTAKPLPSRIKNANLARC